MNSIETLSLPEEAVDQDFESFKLIIEKVQKVHKIQGFIIKNQEHALINLNNSEGLFELALLSSEVFDSSTDLFEVTRAGPLNSVVLKGDLLSVLFLSVNENQLSIVLDKGDDCDAVLDMIVRRNF
jgi:predicted regulator of Ras-like GTPase activity (Roadblock/LC7/MglB family)